MSYLYLLGTILFESIGVALLNKSDGFSNGKYLFAGLLFFNIGMIAFAMALKGMDMTIANTTWAGASILIVDILGYFLNIRSSCRHIRVVECSMISAVSNAIACVVLVSINQYGRVEDIRPKRAISDAPYRIH